jgi:MYXO-CTERM domain-containing protein
MYGVYEMESIWVGLDGVELEATPGHITVEDDVAPWDNYIVTFNDLPEDGNGSILLGGVDVFESDVLPLDLDLSQFNIHRTFGFLTAQASMYGIVTSFESRVVPSPSGLIVLLVVGGLTRRRRRHD